MTLDQHTTLLEKSTAVTPGTWYTRSRARREQLQASAGPIKHLSEDLLRLILEAGQESLLPCVPPLGFSITVSAVCKFWRKIATSTPSLWTTLSITVKPTRPLGPLRQFLSRSGQRPLNIWLNPDDLGRMPHRTLGAHLAVLLPHLSRWHTFRIRFHSPRTVAQLEAALVGEASALEELAFILAQTYDACDSACTVLSPALRAPRLRSLDLVDVPCFMRTPTGFSLWPSLQRLELAGPDLCLPCGDECRTVALMLEPLTSLRELVVGLGYGFSSVDVPGERVLLRSLECLTLVNLCLPSMTGFLRAIKAPKLAMLGVHDIDTYRGAWDVPTPEDSDLYFPVLRTLDFQDDELSLFVEEEPWFPRLFTTVRISRARAATGMLLTNVASGEYPGLLSLEIHSRPPLRPQELGMLRRCVTNRSSVPVPDASDAWRALKTLKEVNVFTTVDVTREDSSWYNAHLDKFTWTLYSAQTRFQESDNMVVMEFERQEGKAKS